MFSITFDFLLLSSEDLTKGIILRETCSHTFDFQAYAAFVVFCSYDSLQSCQKSYSLFPCLLEH